MATPENTHPGLEIYERVYWGGEISSQDCSCWPKMLLRERQPQIRDPGCSASARSLAGASKKHREKPVKGSLCLLLLNFHCPFYLISFSKRNVQAEQFPIGCPTSSTALGGPAGPTPPRSQRDAEKTVPATQQHHLGATVGTSGFMGTTQGDICPQPRDLRSIPH